MPKKGDYRRSLNMNPSPAERNEKPHRENRPACFSFGPGRLVKSGPPGIYIPAAIVFAGLLLIGAAVRLYGAWQLRYNLDPDSGIVALMAKHMAEGLDFPVFYYGQAYMGSLEAMAGALFCFLFGTSGFMVSLGTALIGWLGMLAVFAWARDAHSSRAGLAAMALYAIGTPEFLHYQVSPRGGYTVTILLSTLVLWLASRLIINGIKNEAATEPPRRPFTYPRGGWFLLGLLAGLGWWTNQLVASALVTAALMAAALLRARLFSAGSLAAAFGFLLGSLPFWAWNYMNNWGSFAFAGSFGQTPFLEGVSIFVSKRMATLLDLDRGHFAWRAAGALFYAIAFVVFILHLRRAFRERRESGQWIYAAAALVFIAVSAMLFSTSHFARMNTARYLLPLAPAIAVIGGVFAAETAGRKYYHIGILLPVAVMVFQAANLSWLRTRGECEAACQGRIEACGALLQERGIEACYAPYAYHSWNFALREAVCFCNLPEERYQPYTRRAELARKITVFDNLGNIANFATHYGGRARIGSAGAVTVCWDFHPPEEGLAAIDPAAIAFIRDSSGNEILAATTDGNLDTAWSSSAALGDDEWLEIEFKTPQVVRLIRMLFAGYPDSWQIAAEPEGGAWKNLSGEVLSSGYIWSGPRPYWAFGQNGYRLECRVPPERLHRLRIHRLQGGRGLAEMQLFCPAPAPAGEAASLAPLLEIMHKRNLNRVYCDRWPANALYRETGGAIQTALNPDIFHKESILAEGGLWFTPRTALLARREDAGLCERALAGRLVNMRRTEVGPWVLFDFIPGTWKEEYGRNPELEWTGFACLAKNNKRWAAELVDRADILAAKGDQSGAAGLLLKANESWPLYTPVLERLARLAAEGENIQDMDLNLSRAGLIPAINSRPRPQGGAGSAKTENKYWQHEYDRLHPHVKAGIKFSNGLELAGITLSTNAVSAGEAFAIQYYWQHPETGLKEKPCVFVHFINGENLLQDDHLLESFAGADYQPYAEYFIETRRPVVPAGAKPGKYKILLGLYDPARKDLRRFKAETMLPGKLNAVELPACLEISARR